MRPAAVVSLWIGLLLSMPAFAASVTLHPNGNLVVFEGQIEPGDFEKVEKLAREASPTGIYLASPGGNVAVAMRIGALVRRLAWETKSAEGRNVPMNMRDGVAIAYGVKDPQRNNQCTSACFLIFISGIYRDGHGLGIHRPTMSQADRERLAPEDQVKAADGVRAVVEYFVRRMGVPRRYVDEMYAMPNDRMRWITDEEIEADFKGFVPSVREWVKTQCGDEAETLRCKEDVMTGIKIRALEQNAKAGEPAEKAP
jgi:hypothetical protein